MCRDAESFAYSKSAGETTLPTCTRAPSAVSEYLWGNGALFSLSRTRERVGVRVCHGSQAASLSSLTLALSHREREMILPQRAYATPVSFLAIGFAASLV